MLVQLGDKPSGATICMDELWSRVSVFHDLDHFSLHVCQCIVRERCRVVKIGIEKDRIVAFWVAPELCAERNALAALDGGWLDPKTCASLDFHAYLIANIRSHLMQAVAR